MKPYFYHFGIALDQLFNALLGGYADETLSSRAYRRASQPSPRRRWRVTVRVIDTAFFWQQQHCRKSFEREQQHGHSPDELR